MTLRFKTICFFHFWHFNVKYWNHHTLQQRTTRKNMQNIVYVGASEAEESRRECCKQTLQLSMGVSLVDMLHMRLNYLRVMCLFNGIFHFMVT